MSEKKVEAFEGWAVLELMGHRRLGGYVREATLAGGAFVRIDVPGKKGEATVATQFYSPGSIYCLTPCSEEAARAVAAHNRPEPVTYWEMPKPQLAAGERPIDADVEEDDREGDVPFGR